MPFKGDKIILPNGEMNEHDSSWIPKEDILWTGNLPDDVSRLDMRVGEITFALEHILNKKYLKLEIRIDENDPRICVSKLGKYFKPDDIRNKIVIVLCNVRHMVRGVISNAFIFYAKTEEIAEFLEPPAYSNIGDRCYFPTYKFDPFEDLPYIYPNKESKRVYDVVAKDFWINKDGQAEYKGMAMRSHRKGFCTVKTLRNCPFGK